MQPWRLRRATASRRPAERGPARTPASSPHDSASCRSDGLSTSSPDHAAWAGDTPAAPRPSAERRLTSRAPTPQRVHKTSRFENILQLLEKKILVKEAAGGRSTSYALSNCPTES